MSKLFLKKWQEIAEERVKDLEKFLKMKSVFYESRIQSAQDGFKRQLQVEYTREIRFITGSIEFNKEVVQLLKAS